MNYLPKNIENAVESFSKLPGIGSKTAERLVFHLLKKTNNDLSTLGQSILDLKEGLLYCDTCKNLCTESQCNICLSDKRNKSLLCVVEDVLDLVALEKTNAYQGVYHVLHGIISPIEGVGPDELTIAELFKRAEQGGISEIIIALNPSMEGEATASYITRYIKPLGIKVTRIARGIPVGGNLEYADSQTIKRSMEGRLEY